MEGTSAPDFELPSSDGSTVKLSSFRGKKVILYFFPKAFTPGCTRETERFAEKYDEFKALGAEVLGISVDKPETQKKFSATHGKSKFRILADAEKKVSQMYGVLNEKGTSSQRVTFIIGEDGKVLKVLRNLRKAEDHVDQALDFLRNQSK